LFNLHGFVLVPFSNIYFFIKHKIAENFADFLQKLKFDKICKAECLLNVDQLFFGILIFPKYSISLKIAAFWELGTLKVRKFKVR